MARKKSEAARDRARRLQYEMYAQRMQKNVEELAASYLEQVRSGKIAGRIGMTFWVDGRTTFFGEGMFEDIRSAEQFLARIEGEQNVLMTLPPGVTSMPDNLVPFPKGGRPRRMHHDYRGRVLPAEGISQAQDRGLSHRYIGLRDHRSSE